VPKRSIDKVDVKGKRVLMRVDFNVPIQDGKITDDRRIVEAVPSIRSVLDRGGRLVLMSHLGRPDGTGYQPEFSLEPCAKRLTEILGSHAKGGIRFPSHDCIDGAATAAVNMLGNGEGLLLDNLRFHKAESKGDPAFAAKLAAHGDIYCNNAFGTCHRADASMVAVPTAMNGKPRVCGSLVLKEITYLTDHLAKPVKPFVVILGGAKVSDKLPVVAALAPKADTIIIGGAMAYTFLKAQGVDVGASRVEADKLEEAKAALALAAKGKCQVVLPVDHVCAQKFEEGAPAKTFGGPIGTGWMGLDIGPKTRETYGQLIKGAKTIVWNGPMGVFEWPAYAVGTKAVAQALADATAKGAISIVGGGDSAAAAEEFGIADKLTHVSTGGGASLALLSGEKFQSVDLLDNEG